MKVYILIVNYNSWENSMELIQSIERSTYENYEIIVVDNCSLDSSDVDIEIAYPDVQLLKMDRNGGFAYGNNAFLKKVKEEDACVWMLNPDTLVERDSLERLVEQGSSLTQFILTTTILDAIDKGKGKRSGLCRINKLLGITKHINNPMDSHKAEYVYGASLFCHMSAFREVGFLPEDYFLYWEETDWCFQAKKNGYQFYWCEEAVIYDKVSSLNSGKYFVSEYYYSLNALRFFKKFYPNYLFIILLINVPRGFYRLLQGNYDRFKGVFKATWDFLFVKSIPLLSRIS